MELCRSGPGHKDTNFYEANTNFDIIALVNFYSFLASNIFLEHHIIIWKMKLSSRKRKLFNNILKLPFNNFFLQLMSPILRGSLLTDCQVPSQFLQRKCLQNRSRQKTNFTSIHPGLQVVVKRTIRIFADLNFHGNITRGNLTAPLHS